MISKKTSGKITHEELKDLKELIEKIDPENKVFNDSKVLIHEMEKSLLEDNYKESIDKKIKG